MESSNPISSPFAPALMHLAGFALLVFFAALLSQVGLGGAAANFLLLAFLVASFVFAGIYTKTMRLSGFQSGDGQAHGYFNGQALAAGLISPFVIHALVAETLAAGSAFVPVMASGLLLGCAVLAVFTGPAYCRSGSVSLTQFLTAGSGNRTLRFVGLFLCLAVALGLLLVQFQISGELAARYLGIERHVFVTVTAVTLVCCLLFGGVRTAVMTRILGYPLILAGILAPIVWSVTLSTGTPVPQIAFGNGLLAPIAEFQQFLSEGGVGPEVSDPARLLASDAGHTSIWSSLGVSLSLAAGIAAMPHLLLHFGLSRTGVRARRSGAWALLLLVAVTSLVPAMAALVRFELITELVGFTASETATTATWLFDLNRQAAIPVIAVCGTFAAVPAELINACGSDHVISTADISVEASLAVLTVASAMELPPLIFTMAAAGAIAAVWTTADGLAVSTANTLAHDGYCRLFRPKAPLGVQLFMTRFFLVLVVALAAAASLLFPIGSGFLFAFSMALAAATLFPAMVSRIAFPGVGAGSLAAGMVAGSLAVAERFYFLFGIQGIPIGHQAPFADGFAGLQHGITGMAAAFAAIAFFELAPIAYSRLRARTEKPKAENRT